MRSIPGSSEVYLILVSHVFVIVALFSEVCFCLVFVRVNLHMSQYRAKLGCVTDVISYSRMSVVSIFTSQMIAELTFRRARMFLQ